MELFRGDALNLHTMVEDENANRRRKKKNKNVPDTVPDAAKEFTTALRADFPLAVNLNPFIYFAGCDFHA